MSTNGVKYQIYIGCTAAGHPDVLPQTVIDHIAEVSPRFGVGCATFVIAQGMWRGGREQVVLMTIVGDNGGLEPITALAAYLAEHFHQEEVMVTTSALEAVFVSVTAGEAQHAKD